jgi:predicted nucleic acid-binding Zn ribbon protein
MMPIYTYECVLCGATMYAFRPIDQRENGPICSAHDAVDGQPPRRMARQLDAPMGVVNGPAVRRGE